MKEKVSIIMPVYNGEAFIQTSINTVFMQDYTNIELITVDDGSSDSSFELLSRLRDTAPSHVDMKVIRQENHGICYTRNLALDLAGGEYILFMDQDDCIKRGYVKTLVELINREDADILIGGYELINEEQKVLKRFSLDPDCTWSKYRISAPWGRIFRRKLIKEHHIRFMITKISEDFYFNMVYLSYCRKIAVSRYTGYGWTYRAESESHANMSKRSDDRDVLKMLSRVLEDMAQPNMLETDHIEYMMLKHVIWYLLFTAKSSDSGELKKNYTRCFAWLDAHFPFFRDNELLGLTTPQGESAGVRLVLWMAVMLEKRKLLYPLLYIYSRLR